MAGYQATEVRPSTRDRTGLRPSKGTVLGPVRLCCVRKPKPHEGYASKTKHLKIPSLLPPVLVRHRPKSEEQNTI